MTPNRQLEFQILGPLEARAKDPLPIGGPKQRALLGVLLLHANEVVSADALIDALWGEHPPAGALHTLHVHISQLRKVLGKDVLLTREPGYLLRVESGALDLDRFQLLVAEGNRALAAGDPASAVAKLREALALWRGSALADLAYQSFARIEIERLAELRLAAHESRIEADLALGRHAEVVSELQALVAEHPLRERFRAQLMLALYRCGRQPDALAVYRDARESLREELGLDPSGTLRDLEKAILRQDPALDVRHAPPPLDATLPAPAARLVGRQRELDTVCEMLGGEARLVTLTGGGGTGKTRLALEVAHTLRGHFSEVRFVELSAVVDAELVLPAIAHAMSVVASGEDPIASLARGLRDRDALIVLDNFEQVVAAGAGVAELLAACPRLKLLVTSRAPLRVSTEREYPLAPLADEDAIALFTERAQAVRPDFVVDERNAEVVAEICRRLDGLPLALELAAARIKLLAPSALLTRLGRRLELLTSGARDVPERQQTLRATLDWSYRLLKPAEQALFTRLAVFSGGATFETAELVCAPDELGVDTLEAIASLVDNSLLRQWTGLHDESRFGMLETIREYALERLADSGEHELLRGRHADYFLRLAEEAEPELEGERAATSLDLLDEEHDNLRAALVWARDSRNSDLELRLAAALRHFWFVRGYVAEGRTWLERAATSVGGDAGLRAKALRGAARLAYSQGDYERAKSLLDEALALSRQLGDASATAVSLAGLAVLAASEGDPERAESLLKESESLARESGDDRNIALAVAELGLLSLYKGDYAAAAAFCEESSSLFLALGSDEQAANSRFNAGIALLHAGESERAAALLRESLLAFDRLGQPEGLAYSIEGLAAVAALQGDADRAVRLAGAAGAVYEASAIKLEPFEHEMHERTIARARGQLDEDRFERVWAEGWAMELHQAIAYAVERDDATARRGAVEVRT